MSDKAGRIFHDCLWIRCGVCGFEMPTSRMSHAEAAKEMRGVGWKKTKEHGWICKDCAAERH